jgi:hypothetical protein
MLYKSSQINVIVNVSLYQVLSVRSLRMKDSWTLNVKINHENTLETRLSLSIKTVD